LTKLSTDTKSTEPKSTYTYDGKKIWNLQLKATATFLFFGCYQIVWKR
jgi:hypothetical protein